MIRSGPLKHCYHLHTHRQGREDEDRPPEPFFPPALPVSSYPGVSDIHAVTTGVLSACSGWAFVLIVALFFSIVIARYFTLVYDQGETQVVPQAPAV